MKKSIFILFLVVLSGSIIRCTIPTNKNINVGSIQVLTGQMSKYGKTLQAALESELQIINTQRKKDGLTQITLKTYDDKLDPKTGVSCLNQLISIDKSVAVIGALGSSVTMAIAPIAEKNKVVLISPASGAPDISNAGNYIFRTCPSDIYEAQVISKYYQENFNSKSIAILYINNDYGLGLKNGFLNSLKSGREKVLELAFKQGESDFRNLLLKIKSEGIQVVYVVGYEEMVAIFNQANEMNLACQWLGNNQMNDEAMLKKIGIAADGTIFPGHQYDLKKIKSENSEFFKLYMKKSNNTELDVFAAYGVDALRLIDYALRKGAKTGEEIQKVLSNITNFKGFTATFSLDKNGDPVRELALYKVENVQMKRIN
jgi:branched-chain amino acid transport system substrate-binding protein